LRGRLRLLQPRRGARVTADPLLLADFAGGRPGRRIADLGCGTGVVALALLVDDAGATAVGVEIQPRLADLARRNAVQNRVADRMTVVEGDLLERHAALPGESFDLVVANPPYHHDGRPPPTEERALARQEVACSLDGVLAAARRLLRPRGEAALILPAERVAELFAGLAAVGLPPRTLRFVHSVDGEPARRLLVRAARDYRGAPSVLAPLVMHGPDRHGFTVEAARILGEAARG
jgi:tRNA1Val (adenine37-N6)-methyltransferase